MKGHARLNAFSDAKVQKELNMLNLRTDRIEQLTFLELIRLSR